MKSMDEIYNSMAGQKPKRSMDEIFSQVSGGYDMNKVMSQANQPQGLPSSLTSGAGDELAGVLTDAPVTLASGAANLLGAGQSEVTNPFTGKQLPGAGYDAKGNPLSGFGTAKQIGGAAVETAANVVAPGAGKGVVEASKYGLKTLLPKLAKGAAYGAGTGFGQGFGSELRESQDVSDALVSGGVTGLAGGVIGAGTAGVAAKVSRNAGRIVEDLQAAKAANDFEKVAEIESSPDYINILKANGFNDPKAVQDSINDAVIGVKKTILDEQTAMSPSKVQIRNDIRQGLYDDAIKEILADYNNYGGKLDDAQAARQAKTKQYQELREQIARDLSGTELDPFKNISAGEMKARIWDNLSDTIKRDLVEGPKAKQFINDYIDTQLAKGNSMERLDFLRMSGNKDFEKTATGAQIQTAIAQASRNAMDDIVLALEKSGSNPDLVKVIKDYVELNRLYGVSKQAEKLQRELGTALNKKKSINRLLNMLGGVGLGSATGNPFAFYAGAQLSDWGQRALNNTIEAGVLRNYASKIGKSVGDKATKETPDALKRLLSVDKKLSQKKQAEKLLADQEAARVAEMTYTPENKLPTIQMGAGNVPQKIDNTPSIDIENLVPETPPVKPKPSLYEAYTPESELPTIDAGGTPKSKFSKSSKNLPNISYGAAPVGITGLMEKIKSGGTDTYNRQEELAKEGKYEIDGKTVTNDDLEELGAILYGEASSTKSNDALLKEVKTIADIAFNRMHDKEWKGKTLKQILTQEKQFQAKGNVPYREYLSGKEPTTKEAKEKKKVIDDFIQSVKSGLYKNKTRDNMKDLTYFHDKKDEVRTFKNYSELKKALKDIK